jgi:hypothetical protein
MSSEISCIQTETPPDVIRERWNLLKQDRENRSKANKEARPYSVSKGSKRSANGYWIRINNYSRLHYHESTDKIRIKYFTTVVSTTWDSIEQLVNLSDSEIEKTTKEMFQEARNRNNKKTAYSSFIKAVKRGDVKRRLDDGL